MSDPEYLYACQRAELLGQAAPTEEEWAATRKTANDADDGQDTVDDAVAHDLDQSDESMRRVGGGLYELNSILNTTQKTINRFKTACGSLTMLLHVRVGSRNNTPDHKPLAPNADAEKSSTHEFLVADETLVIDSVEDHKAAIASTDEEVTRKLKKVDLNEKMGSQINKLDSLINKAENAQYSMAHQTKQMKKIINK